jgi:hypothetical protein
MDDHYPTVEMGFILDCIKKSPKVIGSIKIDETFAFILDGVKPVGKRIINLRITDGYVGFEHATGIAWRLGFMTELSEWYLTHRSWKDGAYIVK